MKKFVKLFILLGIFAPGIWFYLTPYHAVDDMRRAAKEGDQARFSTYVNYPQLRSNLKLELQTKMQQKLGTQQDSSVLASLGATLANALLEPMVDALVTPQSVAAMMAGQKVATGDKPLHAQNPPASEGQRGATDVVYRYQSLNRFIVAIKKTASNEQPVELVFEREGLASWKMIALHLPN